MESTITDRQSANRKDDYRECRGILLWKSAPLCVFATVLFLINLPNAYGITCDAAAQIHVKPHAQYNAVETTFVVVCIVLAFLAAHTIKTFFILLVHVYKLNPKRGQY